MQKFDRKYFNKGVSWEGYIIRVILNEEDSLNFAYHSSNILIKMDPPEQEGALGADLGLSLSERVLKLHKDDLSSLNRGDRIRFNATIQSMGDSQHLHHLHTFDLKKLDGHKDVEAHLHSGGRYKFKQHTPLGEDSTLVEIEQVPEETASEATSEEEIAGMAEPQEVDEGSS